VAQSRGLWRDIHPELREIKPVQAELHAKIIILLGSTKKVFQDLPRGHEMICQQSPIDTKITLESNEDLELSKKK
jgi:hypothetical protein